MFRRGREGIINILLLFVLSLFFISEAKKRESAKEKRKHRIVFYLLALLGCGFVFGCAESLTPAIVLRTCRRYKCIPSPCCTINVELVIMSAMPKTAIQSYAQRALLPRK